MDVYPAGATGTRYVADNIYANIGVYAKTHLYANRVNPGPTYTPSYTPGSPTPTSTPRPTRPATWAPTIQLTET